jgi:hypothetical protein
VRPRLIILTCADAGLRVTRIHWLRWGGSVAKGRGTVSYNDCDPFCAGGHFHNVPGARLRASRVTYCGNTGHDQYRRLIVSSRAFTNRRHRYARTYGCHTTGTGKVMSASARFRAFVGCGIYSRPSHTCYEGDLPYANIRSRRGARIYYRLCITHPNGRSGCGLHRTPPRGRYSRVPITSNNSLGLYRIQWVRHHHVLGAWTYRLNGESEG